MMQIFEKESSFCRNCKIKQEIDKFLKKSQTLRKFAKFKKKVSLGKSRQILQQMSINFFITYRHIKKIFIF